MTSNINFILILLFIQSCFCDDVYDLFEKINKDTVKVNAIGAEIGWQSLMNPGNPALPDKAAKFQKYRIVWQQINCNKLATLYFSNQLNSTQRRQSYLLCRGPKFSYKETRKISNLYEEIQSIYNDVEVCIPNTYGNKSLITTENAILNYLTVTNRSIDTDIENIINDTRDRICLKGEKDFENMMKFSKNGDVLKWTWSVWREKMIPMKAPYLQMVKIENRAAKRNGYKDVGASWRDEVETPNLRGLCYQLYESILPLYKLLHGVARFQLRKYYGDVVPEKGPIPAHLLGDLWSQNWESIIDLILPTNINLDERIAKLNWTVDHMARRAEDFYTSLGLPAMTDTFWRQSVFSRQNDSIRCHGTAADMFKNEDYRLLYCSDTTFEDFYVLHHEMGHIQYYMAYNKQPGLFRQANTALHESIGDTIMLGAMTPQHLHRLGLLTDKELFENDHERINLREFDKEERYIAKQDRNKETNINNSDRNFERKLYKNQNKLNKEITINNFDRFKIKLDHAKGDRGNINDGENEVNPKVNVKGLNYKKNDLSAGDILMLKQALNKIPQIPFALVLDEYRWRMFEGSLDMGYMNEELWLLVKELQGIAPGGRRGEGCFDLAAKYHVADNVPYVRYFLSSFVQHQLFERLCKVSVFGRRKVTEPMPSSITLHRCDIYGSKAAGKILQDLMSRGSSQHWLVALQEAADIASLSPSALISYYRPVHAALARLVHKYNIPIGW